MPVAPAIRAATVTMTVLAFLPLAARKPSHIEQPRRWQREITSADRGRLKDWRAAWIAGLMEAKAAGFAAAVLREGALLDPDAGLNDPALPDGNYRCRVIKLGKLGAVGTPFRIMPSYDCSVVEGRFKALGSVQRPSGYLWSYDGPRLLFLGAFALGDEVASMAYARDPDRDSVGLLERYAERRWRLVLPRPHWESQIDVIEIIPRR